MKLWGAMVGIALLAGCGGGGSGSSGGNTPPPTGNDPPPAGPQVEFRDLEGSTPADAALGQPLTVNWTIPPGLTPASITLEAAVTAGPVALQTQCTVNAGTIATNATSATITIPNTCGPRTARRVELRLTVDSASGQRSTATHLFAAPATPETFAPRRVNLPVLRITTDNLAPIVSRDEYLDGQMSLESNIVGEPAVIGGIEIRGRGNSTWDLFPKKPYRLKLADRQPLLGMPSSRDWVLLANYSDKTMLRNALAMQLGTAIGMPWAPRSAFVEVYINDRYEGVYQLIENIKIAAGRVEIDELGADDVAPDVLTGGYLLEVDFRRDGHTIVTAHDELPIVFQDPEEPVQAQEDYIRNYLDEFEAVLRTDDFANPATGYAAYIDADSFIRWFLVNEVFRNYDARMATSCWMYKPRGEKLHMGPLWDFDIGAGNINYGDGFMTTGWWVRSGPWFSRLFEDPAFASRARQMWNEIRDAQLAEMMQSIRARASTLQQAQLNNFQRWPTLENYVWPNFRVTGSYEGELEYLESWLTARIAWMDSQFNP